MPLPLPPIALAARLALGAAALYAASRSLPAIRRDQRAEDALDDLPEGAALGRSGEDVHAAGRWRRTVRLGAGGPGVDIDISGFARVRLRRT